MGKTLSVILLSYYSGNRIRLCYERLGGLLEKEGIPFEFIVMDDGSKDDSHSHALALEKEHANVRAYRLSRNYGSHYSIFAGLSQARGACAMPMVDDEQQPYDTVVRMYRLWEEGHKVIIPCRENREDAFLPRMLAGLFYRLMNALSDVKYPRGGSDLFLVDREVVDILNERIHPINTSSVAEVLRLGFDPVFLPYRRPLGLNGNHSRWSFSKKLRLAKDNFFSASTFPIRLIAWLGVLAFGLAVFGGVFYTYVMLLGNRRFWGVPIPGWTTVVVLILAFGGLILLSLSLIAEYIWRIYEEVKARPGYVIRKRSGE